MPRDRAVGKAAAAGASRDTGKRAPERPETKGKKHHGKAAERAGRSASAEVIPRTIYWPYVLGGFLMMAVAFWVYGPALDGPFIFDDRYLPFGNGTFPVDNFMAWLKGVRPATMLSYWLNYRLSQFQPYSYHAFNVILHAANAILIFLAARKVLEFANVEKDRRDVLAVFASALFLLHPVNTEAVAYVTSRTEDLSVMFFIGAWTIFLYRPCAATTWTRAALVLGLFVMAILSKEHTIVLPALLLLTDYFWSSPFSLDGIRRNWRIYLPFGAGVVLVSGYLAMLLRTAGEAGFHLKDFTWYQYFFTECRAFWVYIRLFLLPITLRVDYDFPISRTILEHGALLGLIAILAAAGAAFYYRRRYPLAAFGFFSFIILMAPTSSFLPVKDPIAEHRLYLSMIGLLFVVLEFLRRVDVRQRKWMTGLAVVLVASGIATYARNIVWSDPRILWEDAVAKSPGLSRDEFQLAEAYRDQGDCARALPHYAQAAAKDLAARHSSWYPTIFIDWGLAYDCLNREDEALAKFRQSAALEPTAHVYSQIGMAYAKQQKYKEALQALQKAQQLDPSFAPTYRYLGGVYQNMGDFAGAITNFEHGLTLDPRDQLTFQALRGAQAALAARH